MALRDDKKHALRARTLEAALVLVDDFQFITGTLAKPSPTTGDVRRISVILRRLLLDGHLKHVAAPRIGRVAIELPDNRELLYAAEGQFVTVGLAPMFGWSCLPFGLYRTFPEPHRENFLNIPSDESLSSRSVSVEGLLSDLVVRIDGQFVCRSDILKFVCYHAFGAHYSGQESPVFELIRRFRYSVLFSRHESGVLEISVGNLNRDAKPHLMDLLHAHLFATGYFLATSPDVLTLIDAIKAEG